MKRELTRDRQVGLVLRLEPPLEDSHVGVERERLGRVLEADLVLRPQQLLVDVGMRLQLDALLVACGGRISVVRSTSIRQ